MNPDSQTNTSPAEKPFKIPVALKVILIIFAVILILIGIVIIMFLVSNAKRKRRDRIRRLRRQAMYEANKSDVIINEETKKINNSAKKR